jgi:23S rRNA (pseudouridine1915-N3)-methyltransferase
MKIKIITVGKNDSLFEGGVEEFTKRLGAYCPVEWALVKPSSYGESDVEKNKKEEGEKILEKVVSSSFVVLLDERGKEFTTKELALFLEKKEIESVRDICFIIGGAYGVSDEVRQQVNITIALSKLTFPHELARLVLIEALYRAYSLLKGSKYHHQ